MKPLANQSITRLKNCAAPIVVALLILLILLPGSGLGGEWVERAGPTALDTPGNELTVSEIEDIQRQIDENIARLGPQPTGPVTRQVSGLNLQWPLRLKAGENDPGFHATSNFFDHNASSGVLDYQCGTRTYDGHHGLDIALWPFSHLAQQNDRVEVIAAAPGTIVLKQDGNPDQSCSASSGTWNAVYVQHIDGSIAWYGHLKAGSLTAKSVGQSLSVGEYLGVVGSSGRSTGPHLHLEIRDNLNTPQDPFNGSCQDDDSLWQVQRPYFDSAINKVSTHSQFPNFPPCPEVEQPFFQDQYAPGETAYLIAYYRDILMGHTSLFRVTRPDGTVMLEQTSSPFASAHSKSWLIGATYFFPANARGGPWTFEVEYLGQLYSHNFQVNAPNGVPIALADAYRVQINGTLTVPQNRGVLANDSDPENDILKANLETSPASGSLSLSADGSFTYTPNSNFAGTDSFIYSASDGANSRNATVVLDVRPMNGDIGAILLLLLDE